MKKGKSIRRVFFGTYTVIIILSFFVLAAVLSLLQLSEIRSRTLNRLEEDTQAGVRVGTIQFDTTFREGETYYLRLSVRLNNSTRISYYTKLQNAAGYHLKEYIDFAMEFHNSLLAEEVSEQCSSYLEPTDLAADRTLNEVNIHSSIDAVNYGSMTLKEERDPAVHLRKINGTYAVIDLSTLASSELDSGSIQYFLNVVSSRADPEITDDCKGNSCCDQYNSGHSDRNSVLIAGKAHVRHCHADR